MKLPSRNQVAAVVFIAGGFIFALAFIPMALEILQAGELTRQIRYRERYPQKTGHLNSIIRRPSF
jgi:hypothetical protein